MEYELFNRYMGLYGMSVFQFARLIESYQVTTATLAFRETSVSRDRGGPTRPFDMLKHCTELRVNKPCYWLTKGKQTLLLTNKR